MRFNIKQFIYTFFLVLVIITMSLQGDFYEDGNYIYFAESFIHDFDLNIINQVEEPFRWLVTQEYSHPTHHSIIQTPMLILFYGIEKFVRFLLPNNGFVNFYLSGLFLSFLSLSIGLYYCKSFIKSMGCKLSNKVFVLFTFSTVLFYFAFINTTVIEIFSFMLSSYLLSEVFRKNVSSKNYFLLGIVSTMLLTSKITYLSVFLLCLYDLIKNRTEEIRGEIIRFSIGSLAVFVSFALYQLSQFGKFYNFGVNFSKYVSDYSLTNIWETLKYGYFGFGGLFYSNIIFLPIVIILYYFFLKKCMQDKRFIFLALWISSSFFQTIFLVGPIVEDHLVGRLFLTSLPLLLFGFVKLIQIKQIRRFRYMLIPFLLMWQIFVTYNYINIESEGHYVYAHKKVTSIQQFVDMTSARLIKNLDFVFENWIIFTMVSLMISFFITKLFEKSFPVNTVFKRGVQYSTLCLLIFTIVNYKLSFINGYKFIKDNNLNSSTSIASEAPGYMFVYITDVFRSLEANSNSVEMQRKISRKRELYFKEVESAYIYLSPDLRKALEDRDYNFKSNVFDND